MDVRKGANIAWLLLTFTLPTKRASQRVEIWRKLQRYGTVPLGNSGYLLPNNPANEERFQWLATAIRKYGGDASIVHVRSIDNISTPQMIGRFAEARAREYQELIRELQKFSSMPVQKRVVGRLSRLRSRFQEIVEVDFFETLCRSGWRAARAGGRSTPGEADVGDAQVDPQDYKSRLWVTRPRPGVDRCASAWLIRRFIIRRRDLLCARKDKYLGQPCPLTCSTTVSDTEETTARFETLQTDFRIRDRRVKVISEIIHDADLADDKFGRKEGYGIDEVLKGWARQGISDQDLLDRGMQIMEGLYHSLT